MRFSLFFIRFSLFLGLLISLFCLSLSGQNRLNPTYQSVILDSIRARQDTIWLTDNQGARAYIRVKDDTLYLSDVSGERPLLSLTAGSVTYANTGLLKDVDTIKIDPNGTLPDDVSWNIVEFALYGDLFQLEMNDGHIELIAAATATNVNADIYIDTTGIMVLSVNNPAGDKLTSITIDSTSAYYNRDVSADITARSLVDSGTVAAMECKLSIRVLSSDTIDDFQTTSFISTDTNYTGNFSYNWTGPSAFSSTDNENIVAVPGDYYVTVTDDDNGCTAIGNVRVESNFGLSMGEISYFNLTGTTINIINQSNGDTAFIKAAPTTTFSSVSHNFDNGGANNGRLRYTGTEINDGHCFATYSLTPGANNDVAVVAIAKNGTLLAIGSGEGDSRVPQTMGSTSSFQGNAIHIMTQLQTNDYLELYVANLSNNNDILITQLNLGCMTSK